jgi:hypothetical protein
VMLMKLQSAAQRLCTHLKYHGDAPPQQIAELRTCVMLGSLLSYYAPNDESFSPLSSFLFFYFPFKFCTGLVEEEEGVQVRLQGAPLSNWTPGR